MKAGKVKVADLSELVLQSMEAGSDEQSPAQDRRIGTLRHMKYPAQANY